MSRIGKKPIKIPQGVQVEAEDRVVKIKGPKGELSFGIRPEITIKVEGSEVKVRPRVETKKTNAFWGLTRSLVNNSIIGVSEGFEKQLEIQGVGYKAAVEGENLVLDVGFSHQVRIKKPEGLEFAVSKNIITVSGVNKQLVGEFAARIRRVKPPEPYKGKGIRYLGERVRRKLGKKAAVTTM